MSATVRLPDGSTRDLEITLICVGQEAIANGMSGFVDRMFDARGSETHDPLEAVEVEIEGELRTLREGDRLTVQVDVN